MGELFGPYEVLHEIASGGMASVYEAVRRGEDGFARRVAIKRIHPHLAKSREFTEMFIDEARIAAQIDHPNVCQVLDFGRHDGTAFLAMELLSGKTLSQVLAALARRSGCGSDHVRLVATLIAEAAEGLHAAHELCGGDGAPLEIVHRDVSPQNLFVTFDGGVKVVDFGVAKARGKIHQTEAGAVKGKLSYMAPEQLAGRVDRRADVWALGVVLWEALALERLFRRDTESETILAVEREPIAPPSSVRDGLTASFDPIVLGALERDREARTPSARALAEALAAALASMGGPMSRRDLARSMDELFQSNASLENGSEATTRAEELAPTRRSRWSPFAVAAAAIAIGSIAIGAWATRAPEPIASAPRPAPVPPPIAREVPVPIAEPPQAPIAIAEPAPTPRIAHPRRTAEPVAIREPAPPAPPTGHGRIMVPARVALCLDAPCRDRASAIFGPHSTRVPAGAHRAFYIEYDGAATGEAQTIGQADVDVTDGATVRIAPP